MTIGAGIDVGSATVKAAIVRSGDTDELLASHVERIRRRDPRAVISEVWETVLDSADMTLDDVDYVASTGEGELVGFRRGHFYSMTTHTRGGKFLDPEATLILDAGALHARAILMDGRAKALSYKMTSQCASGSGQFLENIARYLGVGLDEVGELSLKARQPEVVSSICAVLAETDVINMVSRGISTQDVLRGIHMSMAGRYARLARSLSQEGVLLMTGGLANDAGLAQALQDEIDKAKVAIEVRTHEMSILAGAIGAGLWGAYRHEKLKGRAA